MSVRSDLETRLEQWASSQSPPIEIAWEGLDYTKPSSGVFLQPILSPAQPRLAGLSGTRYRDIGMFHINIWGLDGKGAAETEAIAQSLINLFPVIPKFGDTSIEQIGHIGKAEPVNGYRVLPVSFYYRKETQTI
jgi:hypothetical protein